MIVASYIAKFLRDHGVTQVFGFDGSMMLKIADEIDLLDGIEYLQNFHEQASAFAADAYGRTKNTMGVALVTSGPGAINSLAGCGDAYLDSIPLLIITGNDRLSHINSNPGVRLNGFQDLDIVSVARPITKYAVQITDPAKLAYELEKAVFLANEGRKGPVLIDVPMDIQFAEVPEDMEHYDITNNIPEVAVCTIEAVCQELYAAKRPVIIAGGGIQVANARAELEQFVDATNIPVVTTLNGHGATGLSLGASGFYGLPEANLALYYADVILALGTRFGEQQCGKFSDKYTRGKIIHVDIDEKEFNRALSAYLEVWADVREFLARMNYTVVPEKLANFDEWYSHICGFGEKYNHLLRVNSNALDPLRVVEYIGLSVPDDTIFTNDVGQNTMWVCQGLRPRGTQRLLTSSGYASMGFSVPAAIGAKTALPEHTVVSFSGDGGFQMNLQELQYVKLHKLNIKFVVFNNNTLGMMREVQRIYYNNNFVGSNEQAFSCVDLEKLAQVYDLEYLAVNSELDFSMLEEFLSHHRAGIIDCRLPIDTYVKNWNEFMQEHPEAFTYEV
ncbi:MAG: thiamine pyrophosphate-binding protein [Anaerovibrio sp.]|uniref:thiamine pyrophosphate-binding protein n=1 Tax=Anaerovibrio sp. TaxID=1872532 RepID=UPI0025C42464|nr:thiamine pyrophosphate-binding protein [Anaerovibrio sp.]MBE6099376.1 thiamine pyrophosphate-binding protein [Anaerovibrio sp.]